MSAITSSANILKEMFLLLKSVALLTSCNRRKEVAAKQSNSCPRMVAQEVVNGTPAKASGPSHNTRDLSGDVSNDSTDDLDTNPESLDSSDTECSFEVLASNVNAFGSEFMPPPGLESAAGCPLRATDCDSRMNPEARPFIPSGYSSSAANQTWAHLERAGGECPAVCVQPSLHEVVSKLSVQDAATVMAAINAAQVQPNQQATVHTARAQVGPFLAPRPVGLQNPTSAWDGGLRENKQRVPFRPWTPSGRTMQTKLRPAVQKPQLPAVSDGKSMSSLRDNLAQLSLLDAKCVIFVRKINKLGLNSADLLETHFSRFGPVRRVYVTHAVDKRGDTGKFRMRAAGIGFVAMENAEDAAAALQHATEHTVLGNTIIVGPYEDTRAAQAATAHE